GLSLCVTELTEGSAKDFRSLSDKFLDSNPEKILFLYQLENNKISYLLRVNKKNSKVNCSEVLKKAQEKIGGKGGGRPDMAQGSGETHSVADFISDIENFLQQGK